MPEVEMISTSSKNVLLALLAISMISLGAADFHSSSFSSHNDYFVLPEYDSHEEIATELVAPFLFVSVLLHFALSRALSFILASGEDDPWNDRNLWGIPYGVPIRKRNGMDHVSPDTRRYAMIMSITITASLIPTPYWSWIQATMGALGLISVGFLGLVFLYVIYLMVS